MFVFLLLISLLKLALPADYLWLIATVVTIVMLGIFIYLVAALQNVYSEGHSCFPVLYQCPFCKTKKVN